MGVRHQLHALPSAFHDVASAQPRLLELWSGDLGIDPKRFVEHADVKPLLGPLTAAEIPSSDKGYDLGQSIPASVFLLQKALPDEAEAWSALEGSPCAELPHTPVGQGSYLFAPYVVRRLAGLLDLTGVSWNAPKSYDAVVLEAHDIYPGHWREPEAKTAWENGFRLLCYRFVRAAEAGDAVFMRVEL